MSVQQTGPENVARVGIAVWVVESESENESDVLWEPPPVLGVVGDLCLVELDADNRERLLQELVDHYSVDEPSLRIEIALFGEAGGFFASSLSFLPHWPRSHAEVPAEVFIDPHHRAAFSAAGDDISFSVRHALRPGAGPPKRQFRFRSDQYATAISSLAQEARRLRDDLLAVARLRAPEKAASLRDAFDSWPA